MVLLSLAIQLLLIYQYYPGGESFRDVTEIYGTYRYDGGVSRTRTYTFIEQNVDSRNKSRTLFCSISFWGGENSCFHKELNGKSVTVQLTQYESLFGRVDALSKLMVGSAVVVEKSRDELITEWRRMSFQNIVFFTVFLGVISYLAQSMLVLKKKEKYVE